MVSSAHEAEKLDTQMQSSEPGAYGTYETDCAPWDLSPEASHVEEILEEAL